MNGVRVFFMLLVIGVFLRVNVTDVKAADTLKETNAELNGVYTDHMIETGEKHCYYFTMKDKGNICPKIEYDGAGEYFVDIYQDNADDTDKLLLTTNIKTGNGKLIQATNKLRLPAGNYYIIVRISKYGGFSQENYVLTISGTVEDSSYETEFNDGNDTATALVNNIPIIGNLSMDTYDNTDVDYYKLTLRSPSSVVFSFQYNTKGGYYIYLSQKTSTGELKNYYSKKLSGTLMGVITSNTEKLRLPAGEYYIKICREYAAWINDDYTLKANVTAEDDKFEKEFNDGVDTANSIQLNVPVTGNLAMDTYDYMDSDYYKFSITESTNVRLALKYNTSGGYVVTLKQKVLSGELKEIQKKVINSREKGTIVSILDAILLAPGEYYVSVSREYAAWTNEDYTLTAQKVITKSNQNITFSRTKITKVYGADKFNIGAGLLSGDGVLTYSSSDSSVATIDANGIVNLKECGKVWIYVRASETERYLSAEKSILVTVKPKTLKIIKAKSKKKMVTVKWKKDSKVTGYEIIYSTRKNFKGAKKCYIKSAMNYSAVLNKLKSKKTYYMKVRSYKFSLGTNVYSSYSKVKKCKVK